MPSSRHVRTSEASLWCPGPLAREPVYVARGLGRHRSEETSFGTSGANKRDSGRKRAGCSVSNEPSASGCSIRALALVHLDINKSTSSPHRLILMFSATCVRHNSDVTQPLLLPKYVASPSSRKMDSNRPIASAFEPPAKPPAVFSNASGPMHTNPCVQCRQIFAKDVKSSQTPFLCRNIKPWAKHKWGLDIIRY